MAMAVNMALMALNKVTLSSLALPPFRAGFVN
jgi:hypothetical protein